MRTSKKHIEKKLEEDVSTLLSQLISDLHSEEDVDTFLHSFLTKNEFDVLSKRLSILYWLYKGKKYKEIRNELSVSSATIATCRESIDSSDLSNIFKILEANEWAKKWTQRIKGAILVKN